jgi:hypothetical protein
MHKLSTYLVDTYSFLPMYVYRHYKVKLEMKLVEIHPQLSHKGHLMDGVLVGVGSL